MPLRDQIVQQALSLTPEDRAFVADALEQSLAGQGFATPEIASAWAAEIERRIAAYDRGEVQGVDADAAIRRMRQFLEKHRAGKASP
jgi:putative addiction module component (TIGR02574 family)